MNEIKKGRNAEIKSDGCTGEDTSGISCSLEENNVIVRIVKLSVPRTYATDQSGVIRAHF